jgi:hypothetical protein
MSGKLQDVSRAIDDGFQVADVTSDPDGVDVTLQRDPLELTIHITRDEARDILRGNVDAPWLHVR